MIEQEVDANYGITDADLSAITFSNLDLSKIDENFPKESYRDGQKNCIEFALKAFNSGKRIVILECPTGGGKSTIGMTIANMVKNSYYLTITKILQDQLTADFDTIVGLKGRNAYPCTFYDRYGAEYVRKSIMPAKELAEKTKKKPDCTNGFCRTKLNQIGSKGKRYSCSKCFLSNPPELKNTKKKMPGGDLSVLPRGFTYSVCPYYDQVYKAIESKNVVMNFSSFLYQTTLTQRFGKRDLLIIDEAHNIEPQILDFVSLSINDSMLQKHGVFIPKLKDAVDYVKWFESINLKAILSELIQLAEVNENAKEAENLERLLKKYEIFIKHVTNTGSEWIIEYDEKKEKDKKWRNLTLKPVYATDFAEELLFAYGNRILMMSATILDVDVMCRSLGISRNDVAAFRMKNRFPVENRPIYYQPAAKMTGGKDAMDTWMPKLIKSVEKIAEKYPDKKGIIHTHNFAIMEAILSKVKLSVSSRIVTQKEFPDKRDLLNAHSKRANSIIVAPAMHEGVDLIDDLSRFQVICKIPYANFYDNEQLKRRIDADPVYYTWLTALKLVQSYGRSIRSPEDYADTYIIDEAFKRFFDNSKKMLPSWFNEAIIWP